jgi:hypothetical protein
MLLILFSLAIESNFVNSRFIENVSNFIVISNNYLPIKIEKGDRRYVIFKTWKNIVIGSYTNKIGDFPVNLYDIFKIGSGILSVKNQLLVTSSKFYSKSMLSKFISRISI